MQTLNSKLVNHIDLLESKKPKCLPWKPFLEQVINEMSAIGSTHENKDNPILRSITQQNKLLMSFMLIVIIAVLSK